MKFAFLVAFGSIVFALLIPLAIETESDDASVRTFRSMHDVVTFGFDLIPRP